MLQSPYISMAFVYGVNKIIFHLLEVIYEQNYLYSAEFLETFIVNVSVKYNYFLMDRTKVIRKWTMVTDFPAQQKVYIHLKTLRFWALF